MNRRLWICGLRGHLRWRRRAYWPGWERTYCAYCRDVETPPRDRRRQADQIVWAVMMLAAMVWLPIYLLWRAGR